VLLAQRIFLCADPLRFSMISARQQRRPDARDDARQAHDERTAFSHLVVIGSLARRIW
jgi:hypothetical protein